MARARTAPDVAVIGGGIVGCSVAAFLAEGGLRVRLYELDAIASGASGRNSGIVQHPFDPVMAGLYRATLWEYRTLADHPTDSFRLGDEPAGLLYVGRDPALADRAAAAWADAWPASRPEVIADRALKELEPALADDLVACRLAIGYPVAPAAATDAFAALGQRRGVEFVFTDGWAAWPAIEGGRVVGVECHETIEPAGAVVVAAGPLTSFIVDRSGAWLPIRPSWGVVASLVIPGAPRHGLEAIDIDIEPAADDRPDPRGRPDAVDDGAVDDGAVEFSLVPAPGSSSLGSTFLPDAPDPEAWLAPLRRVGSRYVPAIAGAPLVSLRHCARPVSRDGRPLIGPAPWADGLWVAAGHGPWGISTGPGSARLLADRILGLDTPGGIPDALRVDRFGVPEAGPG